MSSNGEYFGKKSQNSWILFLSRLNVWRDMFIIPNAKNADEIPYELDEMIDDYDYDNPNDSQNFLPDHHEVKNGLRCGLIT